MACRFMGDERDPVRTAAGIGLAIKRALRDRFSEALTCSIGIAPNRLLAKVAGDRASQMD